MTDRLHPFSTYGLDRLAIALSGICLIHCIATTVFVAVIASAGSLLGSHLIHDVGLGLAMAIGAAALGKGVHDHGFMMPSAIGGLGLGVMAGALAVAHDGASSGQEAIFTMVGVLILALGHRLNTLASD